MIAGIVSGVVGVFVFLFGGLVALALFALWLWMLIHAIGNKGLSDGERIVWVLLIIFLPFVGSIIYFLVGRPRAPGGVSV